MMVEFEKEKDGFYGVFFSGTTYPDVVIIRVAGTGAKKSQVISSSQFLMEAGFNVLCLGYQNWGMLGSECSRIPLDYVSYAIDWVKNYMKPSQVKIGMTGISMGALYTLAAACHIPEITSIALASPFDYVMEGLDSSLHPTGHSTFTWQGKELPYQPWQILREKKQSVLLKAIRDKDYGHNRLLRYVYDHNPWEKSALLPIENARCHMLLLASSADDCWPADEAVLRMMKKLRGADSLEKVEYFIYEKGCHNMGGDMTLDGFTGIKMRLLMKSWRTHPGACMACIEDSKQKITDFFYRTLIDI